MSQLKVNGIFRSLQGEGGRQGELSIFIRLSGCNLSCYFCDTKGHEEGMDMYIQDIYKYIQENHPNCRWLVWTGGEPLLQLTSEIVRYFKDRGFHQALETNGTLPIPAGFDYITVSPKSLPPYFGITLLNYDNEQLIDEIRYAATHNFLRNPPAINILPQAKRYYISPIFNNKHKISKGDLDSILKIIEKDDRWRLSIQIHKLLEIK